MEAVAAAAATAAEPAATIETMLPFELLLDILERLPLLALLESAAYVNRRWRAAVAALLSGTVDLSKADGLVSLCVVDSTSIAKADVAACRCLQAGDSLG